MLIELKFIDDGSQGAGAAMTQFGYRIGGLLVSRITLLNFILSTPPEKALTIALRMFFLMILIT